MDEETTAEKIKDFVEGKEDRFNKFAVYEIIKKAAIDSIRLPPIEPISVNCGRNKGNVLVKELKLTRLCFQQLFAYAPFSSYCKITKLRN